MSATTTATIDTNPQPHPCPMTPLHREPRTCSPSSGPALRQDDATSALTCLAFASNARWAVGPGRHLRQLP
jgi:hypothetical protein